MDEEQEQGGLVPFCVYVAGPSADLDRARTVVRELRVRGVAGWLGGVTRTGGSDEVGDDVAEAAAEGGDGHGQGGRLAEEEAEADAELVADAADLGAGFGEALWAQVPGVEEEEIYGAGGGAALEADLVGEALDDEVAAKSAGEDDDIHGAEAAQERVEEERRSAAGRRVEG